MKGHSVL